MITESLFAVVANAPDANMQIMMAGCSCQTSYAVRHILMQYKKTKDCTFWHQCMRGHALYRAAQVTQCNEVSRVSMQDRQTTT
jgi:hypothetical protein